MRFSFAIAALLAATPALLLAAPAGAHPVLMVSIDGLRPGDVVEANQRGIAAPHLTEFLTRGTYATGVRNVLPTLTYPNHTTLITGVWPAQHGIYGNATFDPTRANMGGWYWYYSDIKVPTLWSAVKDHGGNVASVSWPVSVGAPVDENIPNLGNRTQDDVKLRTACWRHPGWRRISARPAFRSPTPPRIRPPAIWSRRIMWPGSLPTSNPNCSPCI